MNSLMSKYIQFCPQSGKFLGFKDLKGFSKLLMPFLGFIALLWIVFRVATKPSRITYPCVRAAMPLASGLVGYVVAAIVASLMWFRAKQRRVGSPVVFTAIFGLAGLGGSLAFFGQPDQPQFATAVVTPNQPMGKAVGIFPGRVVWVHRANATNENCNPKAVSHEWYRAENNNQPTIDSMVSSAIRNLTGPPLPDNMPCIRITQIHSTLRRRSPTNFHIEVM